MAAVFQCTGVKSSGNYVSFENGEDIHGSMWGIVNIGEDGSDAARWHRLRDSQR